MKAKREAPTPQPCICTDKLEAHDKTGCLAIRRYAGVATVCACSGYAPTRSKAKTGIVLRQTIEKPNNIFKLVGKTAGTEKIVRDGREFHARSLSIDRDYARKLSDDLASGKAERVKTGEKNIWILDL